ncbi:YggS family pyridoxal phosphate enzyme [Enterococcus florum]|uniref:Pyridoxal phosphate homeostasis protein n=1 Tax=Enterococcus florum TaxID=2480627 RepID=A0A4P5PKW4_9ENTE|nr:YggS family pyridoxal phosphate-dependent enzyme [Enterococcus florum]GCF93963.1 YggS family pyridoxal phosphate enzyme [Enterococcus florum]
MIADNLHIIRQEIQESCALVSRNSEEVTLVAVTKSVGTPEAEELIQHGVVDIAENRVDLMLEKQSQLAKYTDVRWHLIGNLQRRKVKNIINQIDYFHALDSLRLAEEIQKRAEKRINCFIEVNVSGEETKHGIQPDELDQFILSLQELTNVYIVGLMTMAPLDATENEIRQIFKALKQLQESIKKLEYAHAPCTELSMGMSQDFTIAVEEGATFVRVGTALFKEGRD